MRSDKGKTYDAEYKASFGVPRVGELPFVGCPCETPSPLDGTPDISRRNNPLDTGDEKRCRYANFGSRGKRYGKRLCGVFFNTQGMGCRVFLCASTGDPSAFQISSNTAALSLEQRSSDKASWNWKKNA